MTGEHPNRSKEQCIHAPLAVGQKPFNDTVEMESFTIQVYVPTRAAFERARREGGEEYADHLRKFFVIQSAGYAEKALSDYLCEREGIQLPQEEL